MSQDNSPAPYPTLSILVVTHLRKMQADDVLDEISGTTGFTGAVDGFLVLKRERGQQVATLHVIGRDIEEEQTLALTFDQVTATWTLEGKADEVKMKQRSKERQAILDLLKAHPQGLAPKDIAEHLGKNFYTVRNTLRKMAEEQLLGYSKNTYLSLEREKNDDLHGIDGIVVSRSIDGINGIESTPVASTASSQERMVPRGIDDDESLNDPVESVERLEETRYHDTIETTPITSSSLDTTVPSIPRDTIDTIDTTQITHCPSENWEEFIL